jgi:hypothetical protein
MNRRECITVLAERQQHGRSWRARSRQQCPLSVN